MTPDTNVPFQPAARGEPLDGLAASHAPIELTPESWARVHDDVQEQLGSLEVEVRKRLPAVRAAAGRTRGGAFALFSYRTFSLPGGDIDPVVVGITFTPSGPDVAIEADVSGEQTGDCILSAIHRTAAHSRDDLLAAARDLMRALSTSADAIVAALQDPTRKIL
jgi:hypothetical protein